MVIADDHPVFRSGLRAMLDVEEGRDRSERTGSAVMMRYGTPGDLAMRRWAAARPCRVDEVRRAGSSRRSGSSRTTWARRR